jgi:hypothetical protein
MKNAPKPHLISCVSWFCAVLYGTAACLSAATASGIVHRFDFARLTGLRFDLRNDIANKFVVS